MSIKIGNQEFSSESFAGRQYVARYPELLMEFNNALSRESNSFLVSRYIRPSLGPLIVRLPQKLSVIPGTILEFLKADSLANSNELKGFSFLINHYNKNTGFATGDIVRILGLNHRCPPFTDWLVSFSAEPPFEASVTSSSGYGSSRFEQFSNAREVVGTDVPTRFAEFNEDFDSDDVSHIEADTPVSIRRTDLSSTDRVLYSSLQVPPIPNLRMLMKGAGLAKRSFTFNVSVKLSNIGAGDETRIGLYSSQESIMTGQNFMYFGREGSGNWRAMLHRLEPSVVDLNHLTGAAYANGNIAFSIGCAGPTSPIVYAINGFTVYSTPGNNYFADPLCGDYFFSFYIRSSGSCNIDVDYVYCRSEIE